MYNSIKLNNQSRLNIKEAKKSPQKIPPQVARPREPLTTLLVFLTKPEEGNSHQTRRNSHRTRRDKTLPLRVLIPKKLKYIEIKNIILYKTFRRITH